MNPLHRFLEKVEERLIRARLVDLPALVQDAGRPVDAETHPERPIASRSRRRMSSRLVVSALFDRVSSPDLVINSHSQMISSD